MARQFEPEPYSKRLEDQERLEDVLDRLDRIETVRERHLREDRTDYLLAASLGIDPALVPLRRYIPVDIYAGGSPTTVYAEIVESLNLLLRSAGFRQSDDAAATFGSLRWQPIFSTRYKITLEELDKRLTLVEAVMSEALAIAGAQVLHIHNDRKKRHKADLEKIKAETRKANAEAFKAISEAALNLSKAVLKLSVAAAMLIGTIHIARPDQHVQANEPVKVFLSRLPAVEAHKMWTTGTIRFPVEGRSLGSPHSAQPSPPPDPTRAPWLDK